MKIRNDYVSNSSSSSFMVLGSKYTPNDGWRLTIEDFDNLEDGEMFFAVFPDIGEGDYVFKITPELMMICSSKMAGTILTTTHQRAGR